MAKLPDTFNDSPTVAAIYADYAAKTELPRRYLGASILGRECSRALWYEFRWAGREQFSGRMLRLFETGHREESRIIANLRAIGATVHDVDPASGQQFPVASVAGHVRGHMDGACLGIPEAPKTWHLLEMKTHGAKSFGELRKKGVAKAKPEHFAQMQIYMELAEPKLDRALYFAVNKDTDEIYTERIERDYGAASRLLAKGAAIVSAKTPPERLTQDADDFRCRFCAHRVRCHVAAGDDSTPIAPAAVNCRTCLHATPVMDGDAGAWRCEKYNVPLSEDEQRRGCEDHLFIPDLITACGQSDASDDPAWVEYQTIGGETFRNGNGGGDVPTFKSRELTQLTVKGMECPTVAAVKTIIGAEVVAADTLPEGGATPGGMRELVRQETDKAEWAATHAAKREAARQKRAASVTAASDAWARVAAPAAGGLL